MEDIAQSVHDTSVSARLRLEATLTPTVWLLILMYNDRLDMSIPTK